MTRRRNVQHGQARRHPLSPAWLVLAGFLLAVATAAPFVAHIFGDA